MNRLLPSRLPTAISSAPRRSADRVTAISGSGPAYVFFFIEALEQAGIDLGLAPETVIGLFPILKSRLREIADAFVNEVSAEIVRPFVDAGLPEDEWPRILHTIENLVPIASQVTLGIFRGQFREAIDNEIGQQLSVLSERASKKR